MPIKKTLILSIDGLGTRDLGAYGNTWIETPSFDRLASAALLFEHVVANSPQLELSLAAMLTGFSDLGLVGQPRSVLESFRGQGIPTILFSDARQPFPESIAASSFDRSVKLDATIVDQSAATWELTHCASYFAQLLETRRQLPSEHVLWAHYAGLTTCWDAPYAWREQMVEEDDPAPPTWTEPPQALWRDRDSDEQLRHYQAIAAEVQVLDACLGILLNELLTESNTRLALIAPRGYPLGEHGVVGFAERVLYSELTAVPIMIADFESPIGWRSQNLVQPMLVADVLKGWLASRDGGSNVLESLVLPTSQESHATCLSDRGSALRTADWMLIQNQDRRELYVKPDDRWEFNDVSSRCPEIVEQLLALASVSGTS